ncbi:MAG TPA: 30S ribosomal protein S15 [Anaerolineae bacterium]|jgi:small subunit ribosomal protein S15|nr:30S ribosomal protein S15 [Anaerolineae bacterium]
MALEKDQKDAIIGEYHVHNKDTGSPEVQIALLSKRIDQLVDHLKAHQHDEHSRLGLIKLVGQRRRHLNYLNRNHPTRYQDIVSRLGLRR